MRAPTLSFAVLVFAAAVGFAFSALAQSGFDRPGGDYASAAVANGDPAVCATRCEHDKNCRSWSFSYPSVSGEPAMCWLKHDVVSPVSASCCVSGVRGGGVLEPRLGEIEYSSDRAGGDYRAFEAPADPQAKACAAACKGEQRCRAWTYRRPGYGSTAPRCYLKDVVKPPRHRPCCISGVVR
jgi:hypothetical protein